MYRANYNAPDNGYNSYDYFTVTRHLFQVENHNDEALALALGVIIVLFLLCLAFGGLVLAIDVSATFSEVPLIF